MFEGKRTPVTVFRSTDDGAPKLTNTLGSLKTVLKACLVTGYGNKKGLDWEMLFEETNSAVFRSKSPDSKRCCLKIDNNTAVRAASIRAYEDMTSLDAGTKEFGYSNNVGVGYVEYNQAEQPWLLVGCEKAFILCIHHRSNFSFLLCFGDFSSVVAGDMGNTIFIHNAADSSNITHIALSTFRAGMLAKSFTGTTGGVTLKMAGAGYFAGVRYSYYPDKITGGLNASPVFLLEKLSGYEEYSLRGQLFGLFKSFNNLRDFKEGESVGKLDGSDDEYIKVCVANDTNTDEYYLINTTAWVV